jgi:predicted metalloprotease with PDZ domain
VHSAASSSFEAWTKYYRPEPNTANMTVSYYTKGALIALCFDLTLRQLAAKNTPAKSFDLDQVMKTLFERFAKTGLDEQGFLEVLHEISGKDFSNELKAWVHSTQELPLKTLLQLQGVELKDEPAQWAQRLGLRLSEGASPLIIKQVLQGGPAHACGLCPGDEWLGLEVPSKSSAKKEAWRMQKIEDWSLFVQDQKEVTLIISRDKRILHIPMKTANMNQTTTPRLLPKDMELISKWLKA